MEPFENSLDFAKKMDGDDPFKSFRDEFHIPKNKAGEDEVYFVGNSLGLQPKRTEQYVQQELDSWKERGVRGHFEGANPWLPFHEFLTPQMASIVGGKVNEVLIMNSLTTNLHLMMASFYQPNAIRNKVLLEQHAFPSDHYAVESQIQSRGFDPAQCMHLIKPRVGEECLRTEDIIKAIAENFDQIALVLLPGIQYYTGQRLDILTISKTCQEQGICFGVDLAHAVGNVPLRLHDWQVDFAVWCTYKYLNSGPGSVGGCFVHEKHVRRTDIPRLLGWWGHDKSTRFEMSNEFEPTPTAEVWQLSNPPILSLAAIRASLSVFEEAGPIETLCEKSRRLTGYFEWLLKQNLEGVVDIVTPSDPDARGCQLSLSIQPDKKPGKEIHSELEDLGFMTDWREPNIIRAAPVPLYNRYSDVFRFVEQLKKLV